MPHSMEARVKPPMEIMNSVLRPIRTDSQPLTSGVMIAVAIRYEVSTQVIWSGEAEILP